MDYSDWKYMDIKKECAKRELGGRGKKDDLIAKLVAHDNGEEQPTIQPEPPKPKPPKVSPESPNPDNENYDMAGRWRRRPPDFISWEDEALKKEVLKEL
jgi:hypothetical protein